MSETNAEEKKKPFNIDLAEVNLGSYDHFENYDKIHIFVLTTTLPNPYTLVMFGVLKRFLETIKKQCPNFNNKLRINFLLLHEIAKYKEMEPFFKLITKHYDIFIPDESKEKSKEDALKRHISSIIEMRLNEIKTLTNMIVLNMVDKDKEMLITKDNILNFNYEDIFHRSDRITNDPCEAAANDLMNLDIKKPGSPLLKKLLFEKVCDEKDALAKCLLKIFCDELSPTNGEDKAIFFVIDRWFKEMIEDILKKSSKSSKTIFEKIYKRLLCPDNDPDVSEKKELDLYLNKISKYEAAEIGLNEEYFSSLLDTLSCRLFDEPFVGFYDKVIEDHKGYVEDKNNQIKGDPLKDRDERILEYEEKLYQRHISEIITKGFLIVHEEIITQLTYIS